MWAIASLHASVQAQPASELARYEARKYPAWQVRLVAACVRDALGAAPAAVRRHEIRETLACFHVVFHATARHHIDRNVALVWAHETEIAHACRRFGVPFAMAVAILTWENSGSTQATSYAACVGMGQLSDGALAQAHALSRRHGAPDGFVGALFDGLARLLTLIGDPSRHAAVVRRYALRAREREAQADLARSHASMARRLRVRDERMIARANIEDSVAYMRVLLDAYGGRADLAISAYHNGIGNTDALLIDLVSRTDRGPLEGRRTSRERLLAALEHAELRYLSLWRDPRCRRMLNGSLTMDGVPTTPANVTEALGDESDIYLWKVLAALAAARATPAQRAVLLRRHGGVQDEAETSGFVPRGALVRTHGVRVTPEMRGWLEGVERRLAQGPRGARTSLRVCDTHGGATHRAGVAVDIASEDPAVARLLQDDWLHDRIYRRRLGRGLVHVCLNPRYGAAFLRGEGP